MRTVELYEHEFPARWDICDRCEGEGQCDSRAFSNGFTQSELAEQDPEFLECYMRGDYDTRCDECAGRGKVLVVDIERCTQEQLDALHEGREAEYADEAERAAERRMGC